MVTPQQKADLALAQWQAYRERYPDPVERIQVLMAEFFTPPPPCEVEYEATLRYISAIMGATDA